MTYADHEREWKVALAAVRAQVAELVAANAELLAACEFALKVLGRQTQFYKDDAVLARLALHIEGVVAKAKGGSS